MIDSFGSLREAKRFAKRNAIDNKEALHIIKSPCIQDVRYFVESDTPFLRGFEELIGHYDDLGRWHKNA